MTEITTLAVPLLAILALATILDCRSRRIPNGLSLGGAAVGLTVQITLSGAGGFLLGLLGWGVCLAIFLPFYARGGMAAGDVKLMAAVGAFLGPVHGLLAAAFALVAGSMLALLLFTWQWASWVLQRHPSPQAAQSSGIGELAHLPDPNAVEGDDARSVERLSRKMPYAGAIALGTAVVVLNTFLPVSS